jgi:hypothetical protein
MLFSKSIQSNVSHLDCVKNKRLMNGDPTPDDTCGGEYLPPVSVEP